MGNQLGQCPFLKQECIAGRCHLWTRLSLVRPGRIFGTMDKITAENCLFLLLLVPMAAPPAVTGPPPKPPRPSVN